MKISTAFRLRGMGGFDSPAAAGEPWTEEDLDGLVDVAGGEIAFAPELGLATG